jgi:hypothetical protein
VLPRPPLIFQIVRIIKANVGLEVAFTDVGGWDTHVNEVGPQPHVGQLANLLRDFGDSIAAFHKTWPYMPQKRFSCRPGLLRPVGVN